MSRNTALLLAAFFAGLAIASWLPRSVQVAPILQAQEIVELDPTNEAGDWFMTPSDDGKSMTIWHFESLGQNVEDYGPSLKWSRTYTAGQKSAR